MFVCLLQLFLGKCLVAIFLALLQSNVQLLFLVMSLDQQVDAILFCVYGNLFVSMEEYPIVQLDK